tara:strand:- start:5948 stop:6307 length:360 start_codon:yes stop_codon:yes gene_type:complete
MKFIFLLLFISTLSFSQMSLKENNFNDALKEDIVVVEFYAEWNKDNMVDLSKFKDVKTYTLNVEDCPNLVKKYNILSVPTVIVFYNKEVAEKYEADLTFKLCVKDAYKKVEQLILKKFM